MHQEEALLQEIGRLESKLKAVRRKGNLVVESQICNRLGKKYELLGEWHEALTFHLFDSEIAAAMDDYEGQLVALNNMALVYQRYIVFCCSIYANGCRAKLVSRAKAVFRRMLTVVEKAPSLAQKKCLVSILAYRLLTDYE